MNRKSRYLLTLFALLSAWTCLPAGAEEPRRELETVVVTATRTERSTEEVPAAVEVVSGIELEDARLLGVSEALSGLPGVQVETRNGGYDARLIIRGAGLKARYGVREIMVLLDGVPITDPDGMTRLDFVNPQLIERIDVVKGPNSTLYGANAAGGVVNIVTRSPFEDARSLAIGYGSDDTRIASAVLGKALAASALSLFATHKKTDGWRTWNRFESNQAGLRFGHIFADESVLEVSLQYTEADIQLPGTLSEEQFREDPTQLTDEPFRHSSRDSEIWFSSLKWEKNLGAWTLKPILYVQDWAHLHPVPGSINDGGAKVFGGDFQADWKHRPFGSDATLVLGAAGQRDTYRSDRYAYRDVATAFSPFPPPGGERIVATLSDARGEHIEQSDDRVDKLGVYLQESLDIGERWVVDLGLRYDWLNFDLAADVTRQYDWASGNYRVPADASVRVDRDYEALSPRIGAVYRALEGLHLYGTVATGFQTPQSSELGENRDLDPARTVNYETGLKGRHPAGHSLDLALFYMVVDDEIVQTLLPSGETSYDNAGRTLKKGLELAASVVPLAGLTLSGTYTYSDFTYDEFEETVRGVGEDRSGNRLPYIPRHQYSLAALYRHPAGLRLQVEANTWGEYEVDHANSETWGGYDLVTDVLVGYALGAWDLSLDVQNVFDQDYAMEVTKDSSGELRFRPAAPRSCFAKVTYAF